eukprot:SAG31_NODE_35328_length_324_cov_0.902222_1_plen_42_part_10
MQFCSNIAAAAGGTVGGDPIAAALRPGTSPQPAVESIMWPEQ